MKLSLSDKTDSWGNKFFPVDDDLPQIEVTYHPETHEIQDFYIGRILVTQDDLVVELADRFDNETLQGYINDYEYDEMEREEEYRRISYEMPRKQFHPLLGRVA